jgi:hypothetical protein
MLVSTNGQYLLASSLDEGGRTMMMQSPAFSDAPKMI